MKKRVVSALLYSVLVIAVFFSMKVLPIALVLFVSVLCAIGSWEVENVAGVARPLKILSVPVAAVIPFFVQYYNYKIFNKISTVFPYEKLKTVALIFYVIAILLVMLKNHKKINFEQASVALFASTILPCAFSTVIGVRNTYLTYDNFSFAHSVYLVLLGFFCAWMSDIFAYFIGRKFGKHKMTPNISPNKTWEGAIGGITVTVFINIVMLLVFDRFFFDEPLMPWYYIIPISITLSVASIFGDLSASAIKRNYGAKDYGKIIPGHGGVMDRFDSFSFVMPVLYAIVRVIYG